MSAPGRPGGGGPGVRVPGGPPSAGAVLSVLAAGGAVVAAVAIGVGFLGLAVTLEALAVIGAIAVASAAAGELILRARAAGRVRRLSHQLALSLALVTAPMLLGLAALAIVMFVSGEDAAVVAVTVLLCGTVGALVSRRLAAAILADVESIRLAVKAVAAGERGLEIRTAGADELRELAAELDATVRRLAAAEEAREHAETARRMLVAGVSHDLRTPITSLRLLAHALDDDVVHGETRREYSRGMLAHIDLLSALIDDLFELSRLEAGEISWSLERVGLSDLINETVGVMGDHARLAGVSVHVECSERIPSVLANPMQVQRVLLNLIQNAIRHTPADGTVVVRAEPTADAVEVEIADSGVGIGERERPHVFEAFFRGGAEESRSDGRSGLGLAIARAIVEAHGGRIWLADASHGTRVRFSLPSSQPAGRSAST